MNTSESTSSPEQGEALIKRILVVAELLAKALPLDTDAESVLGSAASKTQENNPRVS